jgi:hypothetical protein
MKSGSCLFSYQNSLKSASERCIAEHLTASDRTLLWLSYIHLTEFDCLPSCLYDPAASGPGRLVSREPFQLPWRSAQDISTPPQSLVALFQGSRLRRTGAGLVMGPRVLTWSWCGTFCRWLARCRLIQNKGVDSKAFHSSPDPGYTIPKGATPVSYRVTVVLKKPITNYILPL